MIEKLMRWTFASVLMLVMFLAGPVAGILALTVEPQQRLEVQRVVDKVPSFQSPLLHLVQEPGQDAIVPPASDDAVDAVPTTPAQEVVVEYGNWVQTLLKPIRDLGLALIPFIGMYLLSMLPNLVRLVFPAARVNELLSAAWMNAFNSVDTKFAGKSVTVKITNDILRQMAVYTLSQAPLLAKQVADNFPALLQKLVSRIPGEWVPAGWTFEQALEQVTPAAVREAAAAQGVGKNVDKFFKKEEGFDAAIKRGFGLFAA